MKAFAQENRSPFGSLIVTEVAREYRQEQLVSGRGFGQEAGRKPLSALSALKSSGRQRRQGRRLFLRSVQKHAILAKFVPLARDRAVSRTATEDRRARLEL